MQRGEAYEHEDSLQEYCYSLLIVVFVLVFIPAVSAQTSGRTPTIQSVKTALRAKDYDKALHLAQLALKNQPNDIPLITIEGIILQMKGDDHAALAAFNHVLRLSPHSMAALEGRAEIEYRQREPHAKHDLEVILAADPGNEIAHAMLGVIAAQAKDCQMAITQFEQARSALWSNQRSLQMYGDCLEQLQRSNEAIPVFQQLLALAPLDKIARYNLAVVQFYGGNTADSIKTLQPLLVGKRTDPDVLSLASDAYEATGDTPRAVELLREAIVIQPTNRTYYLGFAALTFDHASFQVGVDMINAGLRRLPDDDSLYTARGLLYVQLGRYDDADSDFRKAENLNPGTGMGEDAQSLLEASKKDPEHILGKLRIRLKERPADPFLNFLLARVLYDRGVSPGTPQFEQAVQAARKAVELDPSVTYASNLLSTLYLDAGENELALAQCRTTLQLAPDDQTAIYHLIMALRKAGKTGEIQPLVERLSVALKSAHKLEDDRKRIPIMDNISSKK